MGQMFDVRNCGCYRKIVGSMKWKVLCDKHTRIIRSDLELVKK